MTLKASEPVVKAVEEIILGDAGRGIENARTRYTFTLHRLVNSLLEKDQVPIVGLLTGFPVPLENGEIALENDGPLGAGHVLAACGHLGWRASIISDARGQAALTAMAELCADTAAGEKANFKNLPEAGDGRRRRFFSALESEGLTHLISIERPGRSEDDEYYNMRAEPIGDYFAASDFLFEDAPWATAAFADGGNEIGIGNIAKRRIGQNIAHGSTIASRTKVDFLTLAGVSNWAAYGLVALLAAALPQKRDALLDLLTPEFDRKLFETLRAHGIVDGVTRGPDESVDGLSLARHHAVLDQLREVVLSLA